MYQNYPKKRYQKTFALLEKFADKNKTILDIGVVNPFSELMKEKGYKVENTNGEDLDFQVDTLQHFSAEFTTALEILEHLVNPMAVLQNIPSKKLLATIPLRLWFSRAYRNKNDKRDCHYHEFEDWQFDMLLEKSGWKIIYKEKWTHPVKKFGIRPFLRLFTPRYYAVYAEKID